MLLFWNHICPFYSSLLTSSHFLTSAFYISFSLLSFVYFSVLVSWFRILLFCELFSLALPLHISCPFCYQYTLILKYSFGHMTTSTLLLISLSRNLDYPPMTYRAVLVLSITFRILPKVTMYYLSKLSSTSGQQT